MTANSLQIPGEATDARSRRAAGARPDADGMSAKLERLRDGLLKRLEGIEALAAEQAELLAQDSSERELVLRDRVAVLEAAHSRLLAESRRREQEWQEVLRQLETDRRLLAEAWERLEQVQIQYEPRAANQPDAADARPASASTGPPIVAQSASPRPPADDPDDPVTRAILRQFQALSHDVRRNAKGRGSR